MGNKSWDESKEIEFDPCPFCGAIPEMQHIGNDYRRKKAIRVKCRKCRIERTDAALMHSFAWLEDVAVKNWNQRSHITGSSE